MGLLRAFVAVEIHPEIHSAIDIELAPLREMLNSSLVRWVPTAKIHLTLKFLGDISQKNLEMLTQLLNPEVSKHEPFEIKVNGLGSFPNARQPRVIWIGIQGPVRLLALQRGIEAAATTLGYPGDKRPFSPHLTIGRVKQNVNSAQVQKIREALDQTTLGVLGTAYVTEVHLFKSDLKPSGSVYTKLFSVPLATNKN